MLCVKTVKHRACGSEIQQASSNNPFMTAVRSASSCKLLSSNSYGVRISGDDIRQSNFNHHPGMLLR